MGADEQLLWEPVLAWPLHEWGVESAEGLPPAAHWALFYPERDQLLLGISAGGLLLRDPRQPPTPLSGQDGHSSQAQSLRSDMALGMCVQSLMEAELRLALSLWMPSPGSFHLERRKALRAEPGI